MIEIICTKNAPEPRGPYSQAIRANGFIFVSGQLPLDPATGQIQGADIASQTRRVMENLKAVLKEAGSGLDKVVKTTLYLRDLGDFPKCNEVYGEYLGKASPARATAQVARLPKEVLLEIEAIALA